MALAVGFLGVFMNFMDMLPVDLLPAIASGVGVEHLAHRAIDRSERRHRHVADGFSYRFRLQLRRQRASRVSALNSCSIRSANGMLRSTSCSSALKSWPTHQSWACDCSATCMRAKMIFILLPASRSA